MMELLYTCQTWLEFDVDQLMAMGIRRAYVTPFTKNHENLLELDIILHNLELLAGKAQKAQRCGLEVYPYFFTISHPEGNYQVPNRFRMQRNLDGSVRNAYVCFRDPVRQSEATALAVRAAQLGFGRMAFDDDLRDAFCFCDDHLAGYPPFAGLSRDDIAPIINGVLDHPEYEALRIGWYRYKYQGMRDYARRLVGAVHQVDPRCRIGISNSAKRCHDFSGRDPRDWLRYFDSEHAAGFVRLCGECYDDKLFHLVQTTGWHGYFQRVFPVAIEQKAEITSVSGLTYRSPGTVILEAKAVLAATGLRTVHWAWPADFDNSDLAAMLGPARMGLGELAKEADHQTQSALAVYIGHELGPYTPANISTTYGALHDPIQAYCAVALVGLPVVVIPEIDHRQPAVLCSAYISRDMIRNIDAYIQQGGTAILDAMAARCYTIYGGEVPFSIQGPIAGHRYEIDSTGIRDDTIADCTPNSIYIIDGGNPLSCRQGYDIHGRRTGNTEVVITHGRGRLFVLGYDLSLTAEKLIRPQWRARMIEMMGSAKITFPIYWDGTPAVQCFDYGDKVGLVNYNTQPTAGLLAGDKGTGQKISLDAYDFKYVNL
jgi:hypothetical protein